MKRSLDFFGKFFFFLFLFLCYPYFSILPFHMVSIKHMFNMWTTSWTRVDKFLATFWHKSLFNSLYNCIICTHISITFCGPKSKSFSFKYFQRNMSHRLKSWFKRDQRNSPDGAVNNDGTSHGYRMFIAKKFSTLLLVWSNAWSSINHCDW